MRRERVVAVLAAPAPSAAAPGGWAERLANAMLEDVVEVVSDLERVDPALVVVAAHDDPWLPTAEAAVWPGTPVIRAPPARVGDAPADGEARAGAARTTGRRHDVAAGAAGSGAALSTALDALAAYGAATAVVVAADAPDVPGLLVAKLLRGLLRAEVAVCPAAGGGLVALGARLPAAPWLVASGVGLDTPDALGALRAAAPARGALFVGPGWRRIRAPGDLAWLDPGLEGWPATRALLAASAR
jgi:hypothetical protein